MEEERGRQAPGPREWHAGRAVAVAVIFVVPAIVLAIVIHPLWGPTGYAAVLSPVWHFVHRLLTGEKPPAE